MVRGAFRQARPLAEGQKSADVKHDFTIAPPLRQPRQLAEGVEFPEKNAGSPVLEPSFGGGGPPVGSATPIGGDFEPCQLLRGWQSTPRTLSPYGIKDLVLAASDFATLPHARK